MNQNGQTIMTPDEPEKRPLLQNHTAELAVLACLVKEPYVFADVSHFLRKDHFYSRAIGQAYAAFLQMVYDGDGTPPDYTAWEHRLINNQVMTVKDNILIKAINNVPPTVGISGNAIKQHARDVIAMYKRRRFAQAANEIQRVSHDLSIDAVDVDLKSQAAVMDATLEAGEFGNVTDMETAVAMLDERMERQRRGDIKTVVTGYLDYDRLLGGIEEQSMVTIAARPGMGKTSLLLGIALNMALNGQRVFVFSLEMPITQLVLRMLANLSEIDSGILRTGNIPESVLGRFNDAKKELARLPIYVDDTPGIGPAYVTSRLRRQQMIKPVDVFMVDYLQFMESEKSHYGVEDETNHISRSLKKAARNLPAVGFVASQLNRSVESRKDKRPLLSDLRNSGAIEQDSDIVTFIYRDDYYNEDSKRANIAELIVAKHRFGPTGTVDLYWNGRLNKFGTLARQELLV